MSYKEGTVIPDKDKGWDHITDAAGYFIEYTMPVVRYDNDDDLKGFSFYWLDVLATSFIDDATNLFFTYAVTLW